MKKRIRVTAIAIALLLPYFVGGKKLDDGVVLVENEVLYGVSKKNDVEVYDNINSFAYVNDDTYIDNISLEKYEKVQVLKGSSNDYVIENQDCEKGYVSKDEITLLPDCYVEVDISDQTLKFFKNHEEILTSDVVTGKNSTPTDLGFFEINYKDTNVILKGSNGDGTNYESFVNYWMPYNGGEGLHDASWRNEFGGSICENDGSHGCVNMPYDKAKELYNHVSTGTKVLVHK